VVAAFRAFGSLRLLGSAAAFSYTWWLLAGFRTTTVGNHGLPQLVVAGLLLAIWCCVLPFVGLRPGAVVAGAVLLFVAALAAAVVWASAEEHLVMHWPSSGHRLVLVTPAPGEARPLRVYERWWPFAHHTIVYSPRSGWFGTD
jgi:hypothetical protein